jgi:hypothetical protein
MQAILIDPFRQEIQPVEYSGDYTEIQKLIGCKWFTCVYPPDLNGDVIYVDDEGLYVEDQRFFMIKGVPSPLAGYGLLLGTDDEGDSIRPKSNVMELIQRLSFADIEFIS